MTNQGIIVVCRRHADRGVLEVVLCIDGTPLTDLIDHFETDAGMQPAGDAYGGLIPRFFRFGPMDDEFPWTIHRRDGVEDTRARL
ncbi:hypothetical protein [Kitasatospora indigofera]|uniref:hypothetical protein n=1 Tax=Kitasatospora indigofera TaxID=67307 RepID=UPI0033AA03F2